MPLSEQPKKTSFTYKLNEVQQAALRDELNGGNYRLFAIEHAIVAGETNDCRIVLYKSGKCLVQGKNAEQFVLFVLEPVVLKKAGLGYEEVVSPDVYAPHMGIDESGKGDFFGPLAVVAVYTDNDLAKRLLSAGAKDSKTISSDKKALQLAKDIQKILGGRFSVVTIGPAAYNRMYSKIRNVNRILAWAHARAIENLLEKTPSCPRALSDQFGAKELIERALMQKGRKIELVQRHRAESDVAVAAASILARSFFLMGIEKIGREYGIALAKGASAKVVEAGRVLVGKHGPEALLKTAKCHFRTTDLVLESLSMNRSILGPEGAAVSRPRISGRSHGAADRKKA
jgi:ribonuclease HIII